MLLFVGVFYLLLIEFFCRLASVAKSTHMLCAFGTLARVAHEMPRVFVKFTTSDASSAFVAAQDCFVVLGSCLEFIPFFALLADCAHELLFFF